MRLEKDSKMVNSGASDVKRRIFFSGYHAKADTGVLVPASTVKQLPRIMGEAIFYQV